MDKVTINVSRDELKRILSPGYTPTSLSGRGALTIFIIGASFGWLLANFIHF